LWLLFVSLNSITNLIAMAIGVIYPTIYLAIRFPMPGVAWWGMAIALVFFLLFCFTLMKQRHSDLWEKKKDEKGKDIVVSSGLAVFNIGAIMVCLWVVVSFFACL